MKTRKSIRFPNAAICLKDARGVVIRQNRPCVSLCGDRTACPVPCKDRCMRLYRKDARPAQDGMRLYSGESFGGRDTYDVMILKDKTSIVSVLYPRTESLKKDMAELKKIGLSRRELEVAQLLMRSKSRREISRALFISASTMKTHLNNIYKKLEEKNSDHPLYQRSLHHASSNGVG
jgi:DNA-binding CsgD family transcriptional regulator